MPVPTNGTKATSSPAYAKTMSIIRPNLLKEKMDAGGLGYSYGMTMAHSAEVVHLAKISGYTAILMNLEHHRTNTETACEICCASLNIGVTPICVVPSLQSDWISRLLDNGAQGIIVPRVGTADMAREFVKYSKHRPLGERPLAFTPQMQYQIPDFRMTQDAQNDNTLTMPMIETIEGLENCDEIAAVPGVDVLFVGVFDLSDDMGIGGMYDDPRVMEALGRICKAAMTHGKYVGLGGLEPRPDIVSKLRKKYNCVRFVMAGRDMSILLSGMAAQTKVMREIEQDL